MCPKIWKKVKENETNREEQGKERETTGDKEREGNKKVRKKQIDREE